MNILTVEELKDVLKINEKQAKALMSVYCKIKLPKVAKQKWTLLHVQIGQSCNAPAGCVINQP